MLIISFSSCEEPQEAIIVKFIPEVIQYDYSDSMLFHRIDNFFENRFRSNGFNGVVLFAKNGKIVYNKAFGFSNFSAKDSLQTNDAFQLASVSKTITAVAILRMVEDSLIQLDQTIQDFFPKFPYEKITIRQLLSHRSGLPNYMYFVDHIWENKDSSINNNEMLTIMQQDTPKRYYLPDFKYNYCNTNYAILASIIEKITHDTYENYLAKSIFEPLKMENAFVYNRNIQPNLPQEVIGYNGIYRQKENIYLNGIVGDKGVYASVMDLYKLDRGLYESKFIDQNLLAEAFTPHNPDLTRRNRDNYGLGWRIQQPSKYGKVVYHGGWWKGFKTYFIRMIDKDQTIIVLTNVTRGGYLNKMDMESLFSQEFYSN
jgi:CubicO group peptidase (beta-lactamase class C family)|tara:strand:+ start:95 stop:1207 length:1113 start_codon:yes stop_codon:yes gene_type:complete